MRKILVQSKWAKFCATDQIGWPSSSSFGLCSKGPKTRIRIGRSRSKCAEAVGAWHVQQIFHVRQGHIEAPSPKAGQIQLLLGPMVDAFFSRTSRTRLIMGE